MRLSVLLWLISLAIVADQLLRYKKWEWDQLFSPVHHEGAALYIAAIANYLGTKGE